jgi:hypothetical protein
MNPQEQRGGTMIDALLDEIGESEHARVVARGEQMRLRVLMAELEQRELMGFNRPRSYASLGQARQRLRDETNRLRQLSQLPSLRVPRVSPPRERKSFDLKAENDKNQARMDSFYRMKYDDALRRQAKYEKSLKNAMPAERRVDIEKKKADVGKEIEELKKQLES